MLFSAIGEGSLRFHVFVASFSKCRAAPVGRAKALNGLLKMAHEVELPKSPIHSWGDVLSQLLEPAGIMHWWDASSWLSMLLLDTTVM